MQHLQDSFQEKLLTARPAKASFLISTGIPHSPKAAWRKAGFNGKPLLSMPPEHAGEATVCKAPTAPTNAWRAQKVGVLAQPRRRDRAQPWHPVPAGSFEVPHVTPGWQPGGRALLRRLLPPQGTVQSDRDHPWVDVWGKQRTQIEAGLLDYGQPHANRAILIRSANTWLGIQAAPEYTEAAGDY